MIYREFAELSYTLVSVNKSTSELAIMYCQEPAARLKNQKEAEIGNSFSSSNRKSLLPASIISLEIGSFTTVSVAMPILREVSKGPLSENHGNLFCNARRVSSLFVQSLTTPQFSSSVAFFRKSFCNSGSSPDAFKSLPKSCIYTLDAKCLSGKSNFLVCLEIQDFRANSTAYPKR